MDINISIRRVFILKSEKQTSLRAFVDIIVNGCLVIKGLKVVSGKNGLFVSMPQEQNTQNKKWYPTVTTLDLDTRNRLQDIVLKAYEEQVTKK